MAARILTNKMPAPRPHANGVIDSSLGSFTEGTGSEQGRLDSCSLLEAEHFLNEIPKPCWVRELFTC